MIKGFRSVCDPLRPVNLHLLRGKSTVSGVDSKDLYLFSMSFGAIVAYPNMT